MKCPNCDNILAITERHQVEIDYCPSCRGVWLDKGELDKIIEYVNKRLPESKYQQHSEAIQFAFGHKNRSNQYYNPNQKKKSFLGDFFDFD